MQLSIFEFKGIVCRNCLLVLGQEGMTVVPAKYVIKRWSKLVRQKHTYIRASYHCKNNEPNVKRYDSLCKQFYDIAEVACESQCATKM